MENRGIKNKKWTANSTKITKEKIDAFFVFHVIFVD
uniref:Uncharacterized protein n=1 Tax=Candidatus Kentrum sp. FW TaxID=2126338 RepID=A0A450T6A9_9GAMM|nr:MAG: hypothetical protein BECKFW1821A_GA0114235_112510 [Candidatus Kentron sp. FW]